MHAQHIALRLHHHVFAAGNGGQAGARATRAGLDGPAEEAQRLAAVHAPVAAHGLVELLAGGFKDRVAGGLHMVLPGHFDQAALALEGDEGGDAVG